MSERSSELLITDIIESGEKIILYTKGQSYDQFLGDEKTIDAVIRNFEIIGEAANRLPEDFKKRHSNIDWQRIRGFRNRIVHDYFGIDHQIVWNIKNDFLPLMLSDLREILKKP
jgi:uncharacterized protein with HEPN domain